MSVVQVEVAAVLVHPDGGDARHVGRQRISAERERVRVEVAEDVADPRAGQRLHRTAALPRLRAESAPHAVSRAGGTLV